MKSSSRRPAPESSSGLFRSSRERTYWWVALGAVILTWTTLYWARALSDWFRDRGWITPLMVGLFVVTAVAVLVVVLRRRPGWRELAVLALFAVIYYLSVRPLMGQPEEALHFIQYGLVGGFFYAALVERRRHHPPGHSPSWLTRHPALAAFLHTTAAGWADEGIQYVLPNRYYDLRDVAFNAAAAALAIAATAALGWARQRGSGKTAGGAADAPG